MGTRRRFHYEPKTFAAGELSRGFERIMHHVWGDTVRPRVHLSRDLHDGSKQDDYDLTLAALDAVCDLLAERVSVQVSFGTDVPLPPSKGSLFKEVLGAHLFAVEQDDHLELEVNSDAAALVSQFARAAEAELGLAAAPSIRERVRAQREQRRAATQEASRRRTEAAAAVRRDVDDLRTRVEALEQFERAERGRLRCFLSFQFSGASIAYGAQVRHFLELLDVDVVTGEDYEPRPVEEKVRARLEGEFDFLLVIEPAERTSLWTRDELARSQWRDRVRPILLVEHGATFQPGIYGNIERIEFAPGHVGDAFIKILLGIRFVRRERVDRAAAAAPPE